MLSFRDRLDLSSRLAVCEHALRKYPSHIPVIIERGGATAPVIDKQKFLLPPDLSGAQLLYIVRRRLRLDKTHALFLLCNNRIVSPSTTARDLYARHRDAQDGLLYVSYTTENAFG